jgi:hypothetical protein
LNDTHGHLEGDRILTTIASILRNSARARILSPGLVASNSSLPYKIPVVTVLPRQRAVFRNRYACCPADKANASAASP